MLCRRIGVVIRVKAGTLGRVRIRIGDTTSSVSFLANTPSLRYSRTAKVVSPAYNIMVVHVQLG